MDPAEYQKPPPQYEPPPTYEEAIREENLDAVDVIFDESVST